MENEVETKAPYAAMDRPTSLNINLPWAFLPDPERNTFDIKFCFTGTQEDMQRRTGDSGASDLKTLKEEMESLRDFITVNVTQLQRRVAILERHVGTAADQNLAPSDGGETSGDGEPSMGRAGDAAMPTPSPYATSDSSRQGERRSVRRSARTYLNSRRSRPDSAHVLATCPGEDDEDLAASASGWDARSWRPGPTPDALPSVGRSPSRASPASRVSPDDPDQSAFAADVDEPLIEDAAPCPMDSERPESPAVSVDGFRDESPAVRDPRIDIQTNAGVATKVYVAHARAAASAAVSDAASDTQMNKSSPPLCLPTPYTQAPSAATISVTSSAVASSSSSATTSAAPSGPLAFVSLGSRKFVYTSSKPSATAAANAAAGSGIWKRREPWNRVAQESPPGAWTASEVVSKDGRNVTACLKITPTSAPNLPKPDSNSLTETRSSSAVVGEGSGVEETTPLPECVNFESLEGLNAEARLLAQGFTKLDFLASLSLRPASMAPDNRRSKRLKQLEEAKSKSLPPPPPAPVVKEVKPLTSSIPPHKLSSDEDENRNVEYRDKNEAVYGVNPGFCSVPAVPLIAFKKHMGNGKTSTAGVMRPTYTIIQHPSVFYGKEKLLNGESRGGVGETSYQDNDQPTFRRQGKRRTSIIEPMQNKRKYSQSGLPWRADLSDNEKVGASRAFPLPLLSLPAPPPKPSDVKRRTGANWPPELIKFFEETQASSNKNFCSLCGSQYLQEHGFREHLSKIHSMEGGMENRLNKNSVRQLERYQARVRKMQTKTKVNKLVGVAKRKAMLNRASRKNAADGPANEAEAERTARAPRTSGVSRRGGARAGAGRKNLKTTSGGAAATPVKTSPRITKPTTKVLEMRNLNASKKQRLPVAAAESKNAKPSDLEQLVLKQRSAPEEKPGRGEPGHFPYFRRCTICLKFFGDGKLVKIHKAMVHNVFDDAVVKM